MPLFLTSLTALTMPANGIYILTDEMAAMSNIPHIQRCLYLAIRQYMDIATGLVGIKRGISWQGLREELFVEPHQGIKSGSPTKNQIIGASKALERAGLLANRSEGKRLIFECLLAHTDKSKKNKVHTKSIRQPHTSQANIGLVSSNKVHIPKLAKVHTPPSIQDNTKTTSSSSGATPFDDDNLIYPKKLTTNELAAIRKILSSLDANYHQDLLDEFTWQTQNKQIKNSIGYFSKMAEQARAGLFQPQGAIKIQEGRARQLQISIQTEASKASVLTALHNQPEKRRRPPPISVREMLKEVSKKS